MDYNFKEIEKKWHARWVENKTYKVTENPSKPKYYVLNMFPYPSGAGLHVGHPLGYIASDIYARYKRLCGYDVMFLTGTDEHGQKIEDKAREAGLAPKAFVDNIVEAYMRLYNRYEADKLLIPEGNLVEIKFEDFEHNAFDLTKEIYGKLKLQGFNEAEADIRAYLDKKKGYKKNKYQYKEETIQIVEKHWSKALDEWGYTL